jgi:hypothetical protein
MLDPISGEQTSNKMPYPSFSAKEKERGEKNQEASAVLSTANNNNYG